MCFENLPIVFDSQGRPRLQDQGLFDVERRPRRTRAATPVAGAGPGIRDVNIDPVTRIAGAMAFHAVVDLDERRVLDAHAEAVMFRGYELILHGRDPLDAIEISSRACGVCGGVHSTCAAMALEMAFGASPPPLCIVARNIAEAAELFYDHSLHLFLLAGPDYSEQIVRRTNPSLWERAETALAARQDTHGFATVADIMTSLNSLKGAMALEALDVTRSGREIVSLLYGKYPHPSAIVPAGLGTHLDQVILNQVLARITRVTDFAKRAVALWDDLVAFFYEADDRYADVGRRPTNLISLGIWDDPETYDATYENVDVWGARRLSPPGVVMDGRVRTTRLSQINLGIEEFVEHSYYDAWERQRHSAAPDGAPLSPYHPWNKRTLPRPGPKSWRGRYSWSTAPRWDREPVESGPLARQWVTATTGTLDTQFISAGAGRLRILLPPGRLPQMEVTWEPPALVNALERNRARAVHVAFCVMAAYDFSLRALDLLRAGETDMSTPFERRDGVGVGFWEAGRGALTHHCTIEDGVLANYQILTPSTWMASPRDPWDVPGPYEEAAINTPILEELTDREHYEGIDILRAIRSFDPCLPCTVHMTTGHGTIVRDATTCACGE